MAGGEFDFERLVAAARLGDLEALREAGRTVLDEFETYPYRVWMAAIETDQASVLEHCLELGLSPNGPDQDSIPLIAAASFQAEQCLRLLINRGADLNADDDMQRVPLSAALMAEWELGVKVLLGAGARPWFPGDDWLLDTSFCTPTGKALRQQVKARRKEISAKEAGLKDLVKAAQSGDLTTISRVATPEIINSPLMSQKGITALAAAAARGQVAALELLIELWADPNAPDAGTHGRQRGDGTTLQMSTTVGDWTPIFFAAQKNQATAVSRLVELGADVNARTKDGDTALMIAAVQKAPEAADALLAAGAEVEARNVEGDTPLIQACYFGPLTTVKRLVHAGADIHAKDNEGIDPLLAACWEDQAAIAEFLLGQGAKPNQEEIWDAVGFQGRSRTLSKVLPFLDPSKPRDDGSSPILTVAQFGQAALVKQILQAGGRLAPDETASQMIIKLCECSYSASAKDRLAAARLLLALAPSERPTSAALVAAIRSGETDLIRELVKAGADMQSTPQALTAYLDEEQVAALLSLGADPNGADENGDRPLHYAIRGDQPGVIKLLLAAGADPSLPGAAGIRPIELAAANSRLAPFFPDPDAGQLATLQLVGLMSEYSEPDPGAIQEALDRGADPNVTIFRDRTAPMVAAASRWWSIYDALRSAGGSLDERFRCFLRVRDLPDAAAGQSFQEHVMRLAERIGSIAETMEVGAVSFSLNQQIEAEEERLVAAGENRTAANFRAGFSVPVEVAQQLASEDQPFWTGWWKAHPVQWKRILTVPTQDPMTVVALISPRAGESDVSVFEVLDKLEAWRSFGWRLTGIGYDALELEFETLPKDVQAFAEELYEFCPDLIDQGFESMDALIQSLGETRRVSFWWD